MTTPRTSSRSPRRTALITGVSVAAVALCGAFAVSANLGILNGTQSNQVGSLATADLTPTAPQVVNVQLDAATPSTVLPVTGSSIPVGVKEFAVDGAGTVAVDAANGIVRLDAVKPAAGWTWSMAQPKPANLTVTFKNGARTLEFLAVLQADGSVNASVNEPTVVAAPAPQPATRGGEHEYEGGGDDD